jgi:hypothetical protein
VAVSSTTSTAQNLVQSADHDSTEFPGENNETHGSSPDSASRRVRFGSNCNQISGERHSF